jgi:glucans biosynthesis protein C
MNLETRHHSLDALRAGALLLGIALHATMSFLPGLHAVGWPIVDPSQSTALAYVFFVVHIFRMALFFLIAGFFARLLHQKLGAWGFCRHRLRRIGLPLVVAMLVVLPLSIVPMVIAVRVHGAGGAAAAGLMPAQRGVPWIHLWFLYLLLVLSAGLVLLRVALLKIDVDGGVRLIVDSVMRWMTQTRLLPLVLAAPLALGLFLQPDWMAWDGIPTLLAGFIPEPVTALAFGLAMLVGWLLHRQQDLLVVLRRDYPIHLAAAIVASLLAALLVGPEEQMRIVQWAPGSKLFYAAAYATAVWSWCLGLVGLATALRAAESPRWRYLADASYWMYLTHIPVVWGIQVWMMSWPLSWHLKYPLLVIVTFGVLLLSYRFAVRGTWVGVLLNGRRLPRWQPGLASGGDAERRKASIAQ